jgi:putative SOS response-associated peptidase YedK
MCGRFTKNYTWQQLHALYSLNTLKAIQNFQPDFNVCPTDPSDTIVPSDGVRELTQMRWDLIPYWWNKPLKELRLATFNARVETVTHQAVLPRAVQTQALPDACLRLL